MEKPFKFKQRYEIENSILHHSPNFPPICCTVCRCWSENVGTAWAESTASGGLQQLPEIGKLLSWRCSCWIWTDVCCFVSAAAVVAAPKWFDAVSAASFHRRSVPSSWTMTATTRSSTLFLCFSLLACNYQIKNSLISQWGMSAGGEWVIGWLYLITKNNKYIVRCQQQKVVYVFLNVHKWMMNHKCEWILRKMNG